MGKLMKNGVSYGGTADIDMTKEEVVLRAEALPEEPTIGMSVLYIGEDTSDYKYGHVYVWKDVSGTPQWVDSTPSGGGSEQIVVQQNLSFSSSSVIGVSAIIQAALNDGAYEADHSYMGTITVSEPTPSADAFGSQGSWKGTYSADISSDGSGVGTVSLTNDDEIFGSVMYAITRTTEGVWTLKRTYATPININSNTTPTYYTDPLWYTFCSELYDRDLMVTITKGVGIDYWKNYYKLGQKVHMIFSKVETASDGGFDVYFSSENTYAKIHRSTSGGYLNLYENDPHKIMSICNDFIQHQIQGDWTSCSVALAVPGLTISENYPASNILTANPYLVITSEDGNIPGYLGITGYDKSYPGILICDAVTKQCKLGLTLEEYQAINWNEYDWAELSDGLGNFLEKGYVLHRKLT